MRSYISNRSIYQLLITHMYFSISNGKRFFQRIDKIHIKSINDTNKYQSNRLANFNRIIIIPLRQKTLFHFWLWNSNCNIRVKQNQKRKEKKNIFQYTIRPTYDEVYIVYSVIKPEATSLNMNGSFKTKEEVLHTRNSREIPFWRPAERAWNVFLDRIQRAVKKHRDREKLVKWERQGVSVYVRKTENGQVGKEAWKDHWACPDRSNRKTRCFIKAAGSMLKHRPR